MMSFSILISADLVPTASNELYFKNGDTEHLFGTKLLDVMNNADFRCFNLEVPLTNHRNEAKYPGPYLMADPDTVCAIKKINPSLITLGNNHALDQGENGCSDTMSVLRKNNIPFVGAGSNLENAKKPYYFTADGRRVGIYNCSEYEFAAATDSSCGVNPYDPLETFDEIRLMKEQCDVIIVLFHGGKEFYRYPSPQVQRISRKLADCGADVVIWQHTHCIGCEEKYKNATVIYGQGNFLFDRKTDEFRKNGMLVNVTLNNNEYDVSYIPVIKVNETIRLASETEKNEILRQFYQRSEEIKNPGFVEQKYDELAKEHYGSYVMKIAGVSKIIRFANKLLGKKVLSDFHDEKNALKILNVISPENHSELFKAGLRNQKKSK